MRLDGVGVQVAGPGAVGRVGVRLAQPGGAGPERPVDEQVAGQPPGAGGLDQRPRVGGGAHRLTPVADDLRTVVEGPQLQPVVHAADLGSGAFVHRHDAGRRGGTQRRGAGFGELLGGQQVPRGGPDQMVGVADQRPVRAETGGRRELGDPPPQPGGGQRGVHVHPGQVGRPVAEHGVQVGGAGRGALRPRRFVPAVSPDRPARVGGGVVGDQLQAVGAGAGRAQIQPAQGQAGGGQMDVTVHEAGRDETAVEVLDVGIGEQAAADVVAAQPGDDTAAEGHRGRVRRRRGVHPAVDQQGHRCRSVGHVHTPKLRAAAPGAATAHPVARRLSNGWLRAGAGTSWTSMPSPSM
ncbi:hypothetical protein PICSAR104_03149 [Mycobacterium avium subsp. paratuberculosis]|nr:hypothetical protein PICSAR104_03149 [Mycobacterium avium subsp. paratuberculosis]